MTSQRAVIHIVLACHLFRLRQMLRRSSFICTVGFASQQLGCDSPGTGDTNPFSSQPDQPRFTRNGRKKTFGCDENVQHHHENVLWTSRRPMNLEMCPSETYEALSVMMIVTRTEASATIPFLAYVTPRFSEQLDSSIYCG